MMRFNSKHIIVLIMVLSLLLVSSSVVCAQDNNTTNNNNDIRNTIMDDKTIEYDNVTNINNKYSHTVNFVDKKIDIMPMINNALLDNRENIPDFKYIALYNGTNFELIIDHPINEENNTYMMSLVYMFSNLTSANDIILKLQTDDYINSIMLTRTVHVNSIKSYEYACTTPKSASFSTNIINACLENFNKKENTVSLFNISSNNIGRTIALSHLKKYNITFNYYVLFDDQYTFNKNIVWDIDGLGYDIILIDGHNSTILGSAKETTEYTWANIGNSFLYVNNINIEGFNNAIINRGFCNLNNVILKDNKMKYTFDRDWGAGILNAGYCICNNCSFINNYASKGGAVFSQGEIYLEESH